MMNLKIDATNLSQKINNTIKDLLEEETSIYIDPEIKESILTQLKNNIIDIKDLINLMYTAIHQLQINLNSFNQELWENNLSYVMVMCTKILYLIRAEVTQLPMEINRNITIDAETQKVTYEILDQFTWLKLLKSNIHNATIELKDSLTNLNEIEQHMQILTRNAGLAWKRLLMISKADQHLLSHDNRTSGIWKRPLYQHGINQAWTNFHKFQTVSNRIMRQSTWNSQIFGVTSKKNNGNYSLAFQLSNNQFSFYNQGFLFEWFLEYIYKNSDEKIGNLLVKPVELMQAIMQPMDQILALSAGDINLTDENGQIYRIIQAKNHNRKLLSFKQVLLWIGALKLLVNDSDIDINLTNFFETHSTYDILKDKVFKSENTPLINIIQSLFDKFNEINT